MNLMTQTRDVAQPVVDHAFALCRLPPAKGPAPRTGPAGPGAATAPADRRFPGARGRQPSTPVDACGAPTGLDSGEPRWRR